MVRSSAFISQACLTCSGGLQNVSGMTGQVSTQLEIITQLARELGHRTGYYL